VILSGPIDSTVWIQARARAIGYPGTELMVMRAATAQQPAM